MSASSVPDELEIQTRVTQWQVQTPVIRALKCWHEEMDDAANFLCGKALEETLCLAWLIRHKQFYADLLNNRITGFKKICDGSTCQSQPPTCSLIAGANLGGFINWAKNRNHLVGQDLVDAEYIHSKRNDHGHSYAVRLFGQTPPGNVAPLIGSDPDTPATIRVTVELLAKLQGLTTSSVPI
jgi:hypothetical protein